MKVTSPVSQRHRVSVADIETFYGIVLQQTYKARCRALLRLPDACPRKLVNQMALHGDTNPDLGSSKATQHQCAVQGSELACLMPAGQSLRGMASHVQETGSWA